VESSTRPCLRFLSPRVRFDGRSGQRRPLRPHYQAGIRGARRFEPGPDLNRVWVGAAVFCEELAGFSWDVRAEGQPRGRVTFRHRCPSRLGRIICGGIFVGMRQSNSPASRDIGAITKFVFACPANVVVPTCLASVTSKLGWLNGPMASTTSTTGYSRLSTNMRATSL
jgi:hypothetical protein